jgi:hypothetical protein
MTVMKKCLVSGCGIFHDVRTNCKIAANQLRVGSLPEPWLSANRANGETPLDQPLNPVAVKPAGVDREERLPRIEPLFVCPVCEVKRLKNLEAVKRYRARKG